MLRYRRSDVAALLDPKHVGSTAEAVLGIGGDVPVVASLDDVRAGELAVGTAPGGGRLDPALRRAVRDAFARGLEVVNGLHELVGEDPLLRALSTRTGARGRDLRRPPAPLALATGRTGMLLSGGGVAVDAIPADFVAGAIEAEMLARRAAEVLVIEGQAEPRASAVLGGDARPAARLRARRADPVRRRHAHGLPRLQRQADRPRDADRAPRAHGLADPPGTGDRRRPPCRRSARGAWRRAFGAARPPGPATRTSTRSRAATPSRSSTTAQSTRAPARPRTSGASRWRWPTCGAAGKAAAARTTAASAASAPPRACFSTRWAPLERCATLRGAHPRPTRSIGSKPSARRAALERRLARAAGAPA